MMSFAQAKAWINMLVWCMDSCKTLATTVAATHCVNAWGRLVTEILTVAGCFQAPADYGIRAQVAQEHDVSGIHGEEQGCRAE